MIVIPAIVLLAYFQHYAHFQSVLTSTSIFFIIFLSIVILVIGGFYAIFIFASLPYLCLRYLQGKPITAEAAVKKALLNKWVILLNWLLFSMVYAILHAFTRKIFLGNDFLVSGYLFTLIHFAWDLALLRILDKNEGVWEAFVSSWKIASQDIFLFLFAGFWVFLLSIFSVMTLLIGAIWAVPAQFNAVVLLYLTSSPDEVKRDPE